MLFFKVAAPHQEQKARGDGIYIHQVVKEGQLAESNRSDDIGAVLLPPGGLEVILQSVMQLLKQHKQTA